jgi:hypothetical protein
VQDLQAFEVEQRAAPTIEAAFIEYLGANGVSADQILLLGLVEQTTIHNLRDELRNAPPSRRLDMYEAASATPLDPINATVIRFIESRTLPYPDGPMHESEMTAAATLGRLMHEAQAARVPDVSEVRAVLDEVGGTLRRAELTGIRAINPEHPSLTQPEELPAPAVGGEL